MFDELSQFWFSLRYVFTQLGWQDGVDIFLVAFVFFLTFQSLYRTRALQLLSGMIAILLMGGILLLLLPFQAFKLLLGVFLILSLISIPTFFQNELRQIFVRVSGMGRRTAVASVPAQTQLQTAILDAAQRLSNDSTGALIILEGSTSLKEIAETGVPIEAGTVTSELMQNIFYDKSPLHDGAVLIQKTRLSAAGCILPVTQDQVDASLGTRHRAALGLVQQTPDALVIIVSEETGNISVAHKGRLFRAISVTRLSDWLDRFYQQNSGLSHVFHELFKKTSWQSILRNAMISIFLAIFSWIAITYQVNPPQQLLLPTVPLNVLALGQGLQLVTQPTQTVEVVLQTNQRNLELLDLEGLRAQIDLANLGPGVHTLLVGINLPSNGVQVYSISPKTIQVTIEETLAVEFVPTIKILDVDSLGVTYYLGDVTFSPQTVLVKGPRSLVEQVASAEVSFNIGTQRTSFQKAVDVSLLDVAGTPVPGLLAEPIQVLANVHILRNVFTVDVPVQPVLANNLPAGLEITSVSISPNIITLTGSRAAIQAAPKFIETAPIDLSQVGSEVSVSVPLVLPDSGLSTINEAGESVFNVTVTITTRPVTGYLILSLTPDLLDDTILENATFSPQRVTVLLIGPQPLLDAIRLDNSLVRLTVNIADLPRGEYLLPIEVLAPEGIQVELFPPEVRVIIQ